MISTVYIQLYSSEVIYSVQGGFDGVMDLLKPVYDVPLEQMEAVENECSRFVDHINEMREILVDFTESLEMDSAFFLLVCTTFSRIISFNLTYGVYVCFEIMVVCVFYRENFLQVDIFYEELKYEEVEEQEAFPVLALMGEIGGFMGMYTTVWHS